MATIDYKQFITKDLTSLANDSIAELIEKAKKYDDVVSLGRGEPNFDMAKFMKDAMICAIKENQTHYVSGSIPELNGAIADKLKNENGLHIDSQFRIVVGAGSLPVLQAIIGAIVEPGEEIIVTDPTYLKYISIIRSMHAKPKFAIVYEENNFIPTVEELEKAYTNKTKAIMVNSPCNPTGAVFTKKQLEEIAEFAIEKNIIVITDEVYENIIYDDAKHYSIGSFDSDISERTITLNSFSKSYAMTGLRVGYAAGPIELMKHVFNYNYFGHICACVPSMYAALEALTNPKSKEFVQSMVKEYDRRRKFIVKRLNEIGLPTKMPKGAFYTFSRCDNFDKNSHNFANNVLEKSHVIVIPGSAFGPHGEGFVRISYATKYEQIEEAMDRMEKLLK